VAKRQPAGIVFDMVTFEFKVDLAAKANQLGVKGFWMLQKVTNVNIVDGVVECGLCCGATA
jgi:hypothetical protein